MKGTEVRRLVSIVRTLDPAAAPGVFETLNAELHAAVVEQNGLKAKLEALAASSIGERLPTEDEILAYVLDVEARLRTDPTAGRDSSAGSSSTARSS